MLLAQGISWENQGRTKVVLFKHVGVMLTAMEESAAQCAVVDLFLLCSILSKPPSPFLNCKSSSLTLNSVNL